MAKDRILAFSTDVQHSTAVQVFDRSVINQNQWTVVNRSKSSSVSCLQPLELDCKNNPHWHGMMGLAEGVAYMCSRDMRDGRLPIVRWLCLFLKWQSRTDWTKL